jgi:hypothetical protein
MDDSKTFRLGGKDYALSKRKVEQRMEDLLPYPLGKYRVRVNDTDFPPKQVISETLGKELTAFTTMDATRILTALGFEIQSTTEKREPARNKSEILFEQYLALSGLLDVRFEPQFPGTNQKPDFLVKLPDKRSLLFEVKEFRATAEDFRSGGGAYDPYVHIREKIDQGREKFKPFKEFCCCLVLFNDGKPLVDLSWQMVYGAMLGNLGFRFYVDKEGLKENRPIEEIPTTGGKMVKYQDGVPVQPQNQTISAILALSFLPVGRIRFDAHIDELEAQRKQQVGVEEYTALIEELRGTERDTGLLQLRAVLHENPYAKEGLEFPKELCRGPYDERYGVKDGKIQCLYAGKGIQNLPVKNLRNYR